MPKIPKQRTGSGGWPDRARVPRPSGGSSNRKGCAITAVSLVGGLLAAGYGAAELVGQLIS